MKNIRSIYEHSTKRLRKCYETSPNILPKPARNRIQTYRTQIQASLENSLKTQRKLYEKIAKHLQTFYETCTKHLRNPHEYSRETRNRIQAYRTRIQACLENSAKKLRNIYEKSTGFSAFLSSPAQTRSQACLEFRPAKFSDNFTQNPRKT